MGIFFSLWVFPGLRAVKDKRLVSLLAVIHSLRNKIKNKMLSTIDIRTETHVASLYREDAMCSLIRTDDIYGTKEPIIKKSTAMPSLSIALWIFALIFLSLLQSG